MPNLLDRIISYVAPGRAIERQAARIVHTQFASYDATVNSRFSKSLGLAKDADSDILFSNDLPKLRAISRNAYRNNRYMRSIVDQICNNVAGGEHGVSWQSIIDPEVVPLPQEQCKAVAKSLEAYFERKSVTKEIDITRHNDFKSMFWQACWNWVVNGESLIVIRRLAGPDGRTRIRLQAIESDRLDTPPNAKDIENTIRGGVEVNEYGEPVAYHIATVHPGDMSGAKLSAKRTFERVPLFDDRGNVQVLHSFQQTRAGQTRGVPFLSSVLIALSHIDHYVESELVGARLAACIAVHMRTTLPVSQLGFHGEDGTPNQTDLSGNRVQQILPGSVFYGPEEPKLLSSQRPSATFGPFMTALQDSLAAGSGLASFSISKSLSGINYSSGRLGLIPERRMCGFIAQQLFTSIATPVWEQIAEEAFLAGRLPITSPSQFYPYQVELSRATWHTERHAYVDPMKEVNAKIAAIDNCLSTIAVEGDGDYEDLIAQRGLEEELKRRNGVTTAPVVAPVPADDGRDDENEAEETEDR